MYLPDCEAFTIDINFPDTICEMSRTEYIRVNNLLL